MLVVSVVIIIMAPKCPSPAPKSWWQKRPFYQIQVEAFKDSNGDTKGDLNGILEKADYLENEVGVGSIGLSPIFKSNDNKDIDETLGTLADFQNLLDGITIPISPIPYSVSTAASSSGAIAMQTS